MWFDRSGRQLANVGAPFLSTSLSPSLSPNGRQVALFRFVNKNVDVWLLDVERGVPTRFTFDSADDALPLGLATAPASSSARTGRAHTICIRS